MNFAPPNPNVYPLRVRLALGGLLLSGLGLGIWIFLGVPKLAPLMAACMGGWLATWGVLRPEVFSLRRMEPLALFAWVTFGFALCPAVFFEARGDWGTYYLTYLRMLVGVMMPIPVIAVISSFIIPGCTRESLASRNSNPGQPRGLILFALGLTVLFLILAPKVPLWDALRGGSGYLELQHAREDSVKLAGGIVPYLYPWLNAVVWPMTVWFAWRWYTGWKGMLLVGGLAVIMTLTAGASLAKAPIVYGWFILMVASYVWRGHRGAWKFLLVGAVAVVAVGVAMVLLVSDVDVTLVLALEGVMGRIVDLPTEVALHYLRLFPDLHPHLQGGSSRVFAWLAGVPPENLENLIFLEMYGTGGGFLTGSANSSWMLNAYADWGLGGVAGMWGILMGMLLAFRVWWAGLDSDHRALASGYLALALFLMQFSSLPIVSLTHGWGLGVALVTVHQALVRKRGVV